MDKQVFVQNIKKYCVLRGIKPTIACRESGAGADMINQIERRGSVPSVERVQLLAQYLGVTTSELLGEEKQPTLVSESGLDPEEQQLMDLVERLTPDQQSFLLAWLKTALEQEL